MIFHVIIDDLKQNTRVTMAWSGVKYDQVMAERASKLWRQDCAAAAYVNHFDGFIRLSWTTCYMTNR